MMNDCWLMAVEFGRAKTNRYGPLIKRMNPQRMVVYEYCWDISILKFFYQNEDQNHHHMVKNIFE